MSTLSHLRRAVGTVSLIAFLAGCGGDNGNGAGDTAVAAPTPTPTPVATTGCSLRARQDWAAAQLREWYLFPETLPTSLDPAGYSSVDAYVDALTATARGQRRDRYFTYLTSIAEENAYYEQGATAGFGVRFGYDTSQNRVFVDEAFEGAPALSAGMDRGDELVGIGTTSADIRSVSSIMATTGPDGISEALGPSTAGTARLLRVSRDGATRDLLVTKTDYVLTPVSSRYGAKIIEDGGRRVGYLNLRTFIDTAEPALRQAFASFRSAGVSELVIDLRYNGGGLVSIAELMGDLMGANRSTGEVFSRTVFRPEKSVNSRTHAFAPQPQSIAPMRVAFIGTGGTASASEFVINGMLPYLGANAALVGTNTYGKPVGQIARDQAGCDDRLRLVAFATQNADRQGDYFDGLAPKMQATCRASDDITHALGDPAEASLRAALNFLSGGTCTPIGGTTLSQRSATLKERDARALLAPPRPSTPQREVPGLY